MKINDMNELMLVITDILPEALFDQSADGEIIIQTGLKYVEGTETEELENI